MMEPAFEENRVRMSRRHPSQRAGVTVECDRTSNGALRIGASHGA
jgi:hypothetical protein